MGEKERLPALYIPHGGGPCFFMDWSMGPSDMWKPMASWLRTTGSELRNRVRSILMISAHWEEPVLSVNVESRPELFFDYYGFPDHTYLLEYPAPGNPELARRTAVLLQNGGFTVQENADHGFDHGTFIPLKVMFPEADIPIAQLSLKTGLDPMEHYRIGAALSPLRDEGVLILGSGMSFHNLAAMQPYHEDRNPRARVFDEWLHDTIVHSVSKQRRDSLVQWEGAPFARNIHPREEHLLPLMVVAGAADREPGKRIFRDFVMGAAVSGFQFG